MGYGSRERLPFCSRPRATHHSHASSLFSTAQSDRASLDLLKMGPVFFFLVFTNSSSLYVPPIDSPWPAPSTYLSLHHRSPQRPASQHLPSRSPSVGVGGFDGTSF